MSQTGALGPVDDAKYPPDYPLHSPLLKFWRRELGARPIPILRDGTQTLDGIIKFRVAKEIFER